MGCILFFLVSRLHGKSSGVRSPASHNAPAISECSDANFNVCELHLRLLEAKAVRRQTSTFAGQCFWLETGVGVKSVRSSHKEKHSPEQKSPCVLLSQAKVQWFRCNARSPELPQLATALLLCFVRRNLSCGVYPARDVPQPNFGLKQFVDPLQCQAAACRHHLQNAGNLGECFAVHISAVDESKHSMLF